MSKWNRWESIITLIFFLVLMIITVSGCLNKQKSINSDQEKNNLQQTQDQNKMIPSTNNESTSSNTSPSLSTIKFEYFYRGYATVGDNEVNTYPKGPYVIETRDDWQDFMNKYVPGIPYFIPLDFSKESLVYIGYFSPHPTYGREYDVKTLSINNNKIDAEVEGNVRGIYAQNIDGIEHCFVNIVEVNKKDIPQDIQNVYRQK